MRSGEESHFAIKSFRKLDYGSPSKNHPSNWPPKTRRLPVAPAITIRCSGSGGELQIFRIANKTHIIILPEMLLKVKMKDLKFRISKKRHNILNMFRQELFPF